jgi:SAM-dependent methyltransferase
MADYTLRLSDTEVARYRTMARSALAHEADDWRAAGICPGARVADVGCGPGVILVELARLVGPHGVAIGVERDAEARAVAMRVLAAEGLRQAAVVEGEAGATGLEAASFDTVMVRQVLMHNGGREAAIVVHLASLLRPGGHLYLIEADPAAFRFDPDDPDLADLWARWLALMCRRGNDPSVGIRLASLLRAAGLDVVLRDARWYCQPRETNVRLAAWAAHEAIVAEGLATPADVARWDAACRRFDALPGEKVFFVPQFRAVGRRPAA